jgi:hypothetical protein
MAVFLLSDIRGGHFWAPQSPDCSGVLFLGRALADDQYEFIALSVLFGFGLYIDALVLHGDSFLVGSWQVDYAPDGHAESVFFRKKGDLNAPLMIQVISS